MPRRSKWDELEEREGKPVAQILVERLNHYQNISAVAVSIPMAYRHVQEKIEECGIQKFTHWEVLEKNQHANPV